MSEKTVIVKRVSEYYESSEIKIACKLNHVLLDEVYDLMEDGPTLVLTLGRFIRPLSYNLFIQKTVVKKKEDTFKIVTLERVKNERVVGTINFDGQQDYNAEE